MFAELQILKRLGDFHVVEYKQTLRAVEERCGPTIGLSDAGKCSKNPIGGKLMKNVRADFDSKQLSERTDLVPLNYLRSVALRSFAPAAPALWE